MKCLRPIGLVLTSFALLAFCSPETTTSRSTPPIGETIKKLTKQLMDVNSTSLDTILDVRTPPRVKLQQKNKLKQQEVENSHAGVAIPVDEDVLNLEETTKKMNFYKIERPTTNSGLSTWILLSGQATTTKPPPKKTTLKPSSEEKVIKPPSQENVKQNLTVVVDQKPNRVIKPIFKKRGPTTTEKTPTKTTPISTTTKVYKETTKLTKIKASELNSAVNKKNTTTFTTTAASVPKKGTKLTTTTTEAPRNITSVLTNKNETAIPDSSSLPIEAKDGEVELSNNSTEKKKKTSNKRKKNKTRRRKPSDKDGNSTSVSKPGKNKEKPITTQLYNYLAREIMPTVGAGLVGLMVTAGLATYFLYPFGIARRSDDIDRKDRDGGYYYSDDYSGGMLEEEAIGKVIAGMPANSLATNSYKAPSTRNSFSSTKSKYRLVDRRANIQPQAYDSFVKGSVENVPLGPDDYKPYKNELSDKQFVVGNVPKEFEDATPVTVPEHGPRNLKFQEDAVLAPAYGPRSLRTRRKRRSLESMKVTESLAKTQTSNSVIRKHRSGISNEIDDEVTTTVFDKTEEVEPETTTIASSINTTTTGTPTDNLPEKIVSFIDVMRDLIHLKARIGLQALQNVTQSFSYYISQVQKRLDDHYRRHTRKN